MPNDVTDIIQDANGEIFIRRDYGTYHDFTNVEMPNERDFTVLVDAAGIAGTHDGEPVYAADHRDEAGAGFYYEDSLSEETELLCSFVGVRADADCLEQDECCIIAQTGELVCYMDGKLTAWSRDDYRIENDTVQVYGGPHNAVPGEVTCAVHVFVKPEASYPYGSAGCVDDGVIAEAFDKVYAS